ncbi:SDR family oxidoreductase [Candidatus Palauibacter sp.]|uniref:SDR family oxidoreductase n=1 Tax=Candidatus Palauibacter sp. TaxID=3101350 RepID=UPI003B02005A
MNDTTCRQTVPGPSTRSSQHARSRLSLVGTMAAAILIAVSPPSSGDVVAQETPAPAAGQKVTLVTGATSGLGRELALRLGARGDHVIVHGRSEERGAEVVEAINGAGPGSARFYRADFASLDEVRRFAERLLADYERLDILINNAGFGSAPDERWVTEDGHEYRFQVNYLSTFLLTHMLMPRLLASVPARIVNVSSGAQTPIDFDDVMIENNFSGRRAYAQSKLAQILFTHDLAEDLAGTGIVVGSLHPATYMPTEMVRRAGAAPRSTIAEGADAVMQVVDSDDFESGQYFSGLNPTRANAQAYDPEARAQLRELSERLTGLRCEMGHCRLVGQG